MRRVRWTREVIAFAKRDEKNEGKEVLIDAIPLFEVLSISEMNQGANEAPTNEASNENMSSKNLLKKGNFATMIINVIYLSFSPVSQLFVFVPYL